MIVFLGLDFLERHNCLMNLKGHCLRIGSQEIPSQTPPCWQVVLSSDVSILSLSEVIIPVNTGSGVGNIEFNDTSRSACGQCVGCKNTCRPAKTDSTLNVTQEQNAIHRGATLGSFEPVACVTIWRPPKPTGEVGVVRRHHQRSFPLI